MGRPHQAHGTLPRQSGPVGRGLLWVTRLQGQLDSQQEAMLRLLIKVPLCAGENIDFEIVSPPCSFKILHIFSSKMYKEYKT